jgi:hypothetical protein
VLLASLVHAQTAPIRFAERAAQVKQMLERPRRGWIENNNIIKKLNRSRIAGINEDQE